MRKSQVSSRVSVGLSISFFAVWIGLVNAASAQAPFEKLVDFSLTDLHGSIQQRGVTIGTVTFFVASVPSMGDELWRSDGTAAGTTVITEAIVPGPDGLMPTDLTVVGDTLFFVVGSVDLWKSDGTTAGTVFLKTVKSPSVFGGPMTFLTAVGNTLFFVADDGDGIFGGLWKSDGTSAGTQKVKAAGVPSRLTAAGGVLFLTRQDANGTELWKSDGSEAGTVMVKDIRPGSASGLQWTTTAMTTVGNTVYFAADDGTNGLELWRSDGTAAGTTMIADVSAGASGSSPTFVAELDGKVFFSTVGVSGFELWTTDGTAAGTIFLQSISVGSGLKVGAKLFFTAEDAAHGAELWVSDGTIAGTVLVKDIAPGATSATPAAFANCNGLLVFSASNGIPDQRNLWRSDGTDLGTTPLTSSNTASLIVTTGTSDTVLFVSQDLWKTDGTVPGTVFVENLGEGSVGVPTDYGSGSLADAVDLGSIELRNSIGGVIWRSDGTPSGTMEVGIGSGGSLVRLGTQAIYAGGGGLRSTDGTVAGTSVLVDTPDPYDSFYGLVRSGSLVFAINIRQPPLSSGQGRSYELWRTDGTAAGTFRILDNDFFLFVNPALLTDVDGTLFFKRDITSLEIWKSDGTVAGTQLVKEFSSGEFSQPYSFVSHAGLLYFLRKEGNNGQLWRSDGTTAGTVLVSSFGSYATGYRPIGLASVGGRLFFSGSSFEYGEELWVSDGTAAGTIQVKDIAPGTTGSRPSSIVGANGIAFFVANDRVHGWELWRSDGTASGTMLLRDITPGTASRFIEGSNIPLDPFYFLAVGPYLYFSADDGTWGRELWRSDGTTAGTIRIGDIAPGWAGSRPIVLSLAAGSVLFQAGLDRDFYRLPGAATCGNGVVDADETCDDGDLDNDDGCNVACQPSGCGDGFVAGTETCDDGNPIDTDACPSNCQVATCGDGFARADFEACDDGDAIEGNGCDSNCLPTGCGNGIVSAGEECDEGLANGMGACSSTCTLCGNGVTSGAEQCDDGNGIDTDGCTNHCSVCGNGAAGPGETCDDGNLTDNDGCDSNCTLTACGNGVIAGAEQCDDGNRFGGDCCGSTCAFDANGAACASDGNDCTSDTCNGSGICGHAAVSGSCNDGVFCNGADTCDAGACTQHAGDPCASGGACANTCNEAADTCLLAAATPCTSDGNPCTIDECNAAGTCTHAGHTGSCDDGIFCNGSDTCVSATCQHGGDPCAEGIACQDACNESADNCLADSGTECTDPMDVCLHGTCDGAGTCDSTDIPASSCRAAGKSSLAMKRNSTDASKDAIKFDWANGATLPFEEILNPTTTDAYTLCVYDANGLVSRLAVPPAGTCDGDPCWTYKNSGYKYKDKAGSNDGITSIQLKSGDKPKAGIKGKGANLPDVTLPLAGPLTAQLFRAAGELCLEGTYAGEQILKNDGEQVKAKAP